MTMVSEHSYAEMPPNRNPLFHDIMGAVVMLCSIATVMMVYLIITYAWESQDSRRRILNNQEIVIANLKLTHGLLHARGCRIEGWNK